MNFKITHQIRVLTICATMVAGVLLGSLPQAASADDEDRRGLTGTWLVSVQQYDCLSGSAIGMPFDSFLTFGADRTLTETTANPTFEPGQRSPGHGFWRRTGHGNFRAVSEAFIIFSSPVRGAIPGFDVGRQRIDQSIDYAGGDRLSSEAVVQFTDPSGTVKRSGCAKASGTRMQ